MSDPIFELINDLTCNKKPSLEWVMKWSKNGQDPLKTAWEHSNGPISMLLFLQIYDTRNYIKAQQVISNFIYENKDERDRFNGSTVRNIRSAVPTLITLEELLNKLKK